MQYATEYMQCSMQLYHVQYNMLYHIEYNIHYHVQCNMQYHAIQYTIHYCYRTQGIQITATTPTSNAIRFETSEIEMELSNRVQRITAKDDPQKGNVNSGREM